MSTEVENEDTSNVDEGQPDVTELQAQIDRLTAESAKYRNINKKLVSEQAELKKKQTSEQDDNYKELFAKQTEQHNQLLNKVRDSSIDSSVKTVLQRAKINPDFLDAATKLIDRNLIEWDLDNGVDSVSVDAAVKKFKSSLGSAMFESTVPKTDTKLPSDGLQGKQKTITRAEFDNLSPRDKSVAAQTYKII